MNTQPHDPGLFHARSVVRGYLIDAYLSPDIRPCHLFYMLSFDHRCTDSYPLQTVRALGSVTTGPSRLQARYPIANRAARLIRW